MAVTVVANKDNLNQNLVLISGGTSTYTANYGDLIVVSNAAAATTITLPAPKGLNKVTVKRGDAGAGVLTVNPPTGVPIDNGTAGTGVTVATGGVAATSFTGDGVSGVYWTAL